MQSQISDSRKIFNLIGNDYLLSLSVSPEFQGRGLGKSMLCNAFRIYIGNFKAEIKKKYCLN